MAIENNSGNITVTGEHTALFQILVVMRALALECNTTMRASRGSAMQTANGIAGQLDVAAVQEATGVRVATLGLKRTKRGALLDLMTYAAIVWRWAPTGDGDSTVRAIGGPDKWAPVARKVAKVHAAVDAAKAKQTADARA